jgi:hypothetical protein
MPQYVLPSLYWFYRRLKVLKPHILSKTARHAHDESECNLLNEWQESDTGLEINGKACNLLREFLTRNFPCFLPCSFLVLYAIKRYVETDV